MSVSCFKSSMGEFYSVTDCEILSDLYTYIKRDNENTDYSALAKKIISEYPQFVKDIKRVAIEDTKVKKKICDYDDCQIANVLLSDVTDKNQDDYCRNAMIAILKVLDNIEKKDLKFYRGEDHIDKHVFGDTAAFLYHLLFQILEFTEQIASLKENRNYNRSNSRKQLRAFEVFDLARRLPRYRVYYNDIAQQPESAFLIRQAIEIRTMELLGICSVFNKKSNSPIKISPDAFINLLADKRVLLPGNLTANLIIKIHAWTNSFVHTGRSYYQWQTEYFWEVLSSFIFDEVLIDRDYMLEIPQKAIEIVKEEKRDDCEVIMSADYIRKYR